MIKQRSFAPDNDIEGKISAAYMRGFESGVKGEPTPDHKTKGGAFERGWIVGAIARKNELETSKLYAQLVIASPAMAQARANAGDEPTEPAPLPECSCLQTAPGLQCPEHGPKACRRVLR